MEEDKIKKNNRREFLKKSGGLLAGAAAVSAASNSMAEMLYEEKKEKRVKGLSFSGKRPQYEVYALKYGVKIEPNFAVYWLGMPPLSPNQATQEFYWYFWLIKGPDGNVLYDTGCDAKKAKGSHVKNYENPINVLDRLNLSPKDINTVILSHFHNDHSDGVSMFQEKGMNANYYLQEEAYHWASQVAPKYPIYGMFNVPDQLDLSLVTQSLFKQKVALVPGTHAGRPIEIMPGISVQRVDGHFPGLQMAIVNTAKGPVVLTSDAAYIYGNLEKGWPVGILQNSSLEAMDAISVIKDHQQNGAIVIPGHDPKVARIYPEVKQGIYRIA